ncbi:MAG: cardiolipin synthase [Candidatus Fimivivens sp.]|nr:cardiolipin synthase [Candidatus Fimivivens sp.]
MKPPRLLRLLCCRAVLLPAFVLLESALLFCGVWLLARRSPLLALLLHTMSMLAVLYIVSKHDNPYYKLAWVVLILMVPILGGFIYLIAGNKRLPRRLKQQLVSYYQQSLSTVCMDSGSETSLTSLDEHLALQSMYLKNCTGFAAWQNTTCEFFPSGSALFERMCHELETAEKFIFLEYFIISPGVLWNRILTILEKKVKAGILVRIMFDDVGTINRLPRHYERILREKGIEVTVFNPCRVHINAAMNYRDHRKLCIIDGNVGFCGGANLADEYINRLPRCGHWKDSGVLLKGHGVWNLTLLFLGLWGFSNNERLHDFSLFVPTITCRSDGFVQAFGDSPLDNLYVAETFCLKSIARATKYIYITTPYLVLGHEMISALGSAALSGVDVRIITPAVPDKWYVHTISRSYYASLLRYGVRIFEYQPGFIHAKQLVSDDITAMVGTTNLDFRSFYLHFECAVCLYGCSAIKSILNDVKSTLVCCKEITFDDTQRFPLWQRIIAAVLRPFAPLF